MFYILQCLYQLEGGEVVGVGGTLCMCESERRVEEKRDCFSARQYTTTLLMMVTLIPPLLLYPGTIM